MVFGGDQRPYFYQISISTKVQAKNIWEISALSIWGWPGSIFSYLQPFLPVGGEVSPASEYKCGKYFSLFYFLKVHVGSKCACYVNKWTHKAYMMLLLWKYSLELYNLENTVLKIQFVKIQFGRIPRKIDRQVGKFLVFTWFLESENWVRFTDGAPCVQF